MLKFITRRVLWSIPVFLTILLVVFLLMHTIPGSPWDGEGGKRALSNIAMDQTTQQALNQRYGLNDPLWKQFRGYVIGRTDEKGEFICGLICGNMAPSYRQRGRTIQDILFSVPEGRSFFESRFGNSMRLGLSAFLFAAGLGIPLGISSALRQGSWLDYTIRTFATLAISLPNFVTGLLLIILLGTGLHLIVISPTSWHTFDPRVWALPIFVLGISILAAFIRLTRASLLDVIRRDYVRTARAKGAQEKRIIYLHMLKNAMIPLITFSGPALMELFTGTFVIEIMFGFPGMGREYIEAVAGKDYSMILGVTVVYTFLITSINLLVDLLYGYLDPRIRLE